MSKLTRLALLCAALTLVSSAALAGGPLIVFDPSTRTPYAYGPGTVNVYTDLGENGFLTGADSDLHTANGYAEWTNVASSYFSAAVAGDFASIGLPDITGANAGSVVGTFNGGGIHVMYDDDGSITFNFFGAPPGVLGIASPDFAVPGTPEINESWALLNGTAADPADVGGQSFSGVFTHEFGHTINLAHTQTNGAVGFFGDSDVPSGCAPEAWSGGLTFNEFETMYPFLDPSAGSVGIQQATVNVLDDIASVSDVYPAAGWPNNTGTITGRVYMPDGVTEVTGVNVIARNVADPFEDATSGLTGDFTQGDLGPDGLFTLNGLTPGAEYVIYIDEIVAGGFSTPPAMVSPEEWWNASESNDDAIDDVCENTGIFAVAGSPFSADIIMNGNPNALPLGDDDFIEVALPFTFDQCGTSYNSVFVGSNGYLTFGAGDTDFSPSIGDFLTQEPRIAGFWTDLSPNQGGAVTAEQVGADFVVTWENVPQFNTGNSNSFAITLRADGTYDITYGVMAAVSGLVGRTEGGGVLDPGETDLSAAIPPIGDGEGTVYEIFSGDQDVAGSTLTFGVCVPDTSGGTVIVLGDDDFEEVDLPFEFEFCDVAYTSVFIGSNGYLTFGSGDTDFSPSVPEFLDNEPRIAALWTDFSPNQAGLVTVFEDGEGNFVISFAGVTEFLAGNSNNFNYILRPDGSYSVEYGQMDASSGLSGRTVGGGDFDPGTIDLTAATQPVGEGISTVYELFSGDLDLENLSIDYALCEVVPPAAIVLNPTSISENVGYGFSLDVPLTIENTGGLDLNFQIVDNQPSATRAAGMEQPGMLAWRAFPEPTQKYEPTPEHQVKLEREVDIAEQQRKIAARNATPTFHRDDNVGMPHQFGLALLSEDFDSGFPAGWTAIDNEGNGVIWSVPQLDAGNFTGGTGDAAGASSDAAGPAEFDTELITPVITGFGPNVVLSYTANYQNFGFLDFLDTDISTDGGATWTTVLSWNEDHGGFFGPPGEQVVLNLDAFIGGAESFQIRWRYYDPNSGDFDWYAQIDDVSVVSDAVLVDCDWLSVSPGSGTVPGFSSSVATVTLDATTTLPGVYNCELIVTSNAVNTPRVVVPVQMTVADVTPPVVACTATEVGPDYEVDWGTNSKGQIKWKVKEDKKGVYEINFSASDDLDPSVVVEAVLDVGCQQVPVENGQVVAIMCKQELCKVENHQGMLYAKGVDVQLVVTATDAAGNVGICETVICGSPDPTAPDTVFQKEPDVQAPKRTGIAKISPNPFNPRTTVSFSLEQDQRVSVRIFDTRGRLVTTLVDEVRAPGTYEVIWEGQSASGGGAPSGVYFAHFQSGSTVETRKITLLK